MASQFIIILLEVLLVVLFIVLLVLSRKYLEKQESEKEALSKTEKIEEKITKYFDEGIAVQEKKKFSEMEEFKQKIQADIEKKSEIRTEKTKKIIEEKTGENTVINYGGKMFQSFGVGLSSAMPKDEKERTQDLGDLMDAVKALEGFDQDNYKEKSAAAQDDMGRGMFFDRITTKLNKAMRKEQLHKEEFVVYDKLVYLGLKAIKNITRKDLMDAVRYLKEAYYIRDYIEVNPQLIIITRSKQKIEFSNPEKVVLSFAHDAMDELSIEDIMKQSKWAKDYTIDVVNGLVDKGIAMIMDNKITINGFETKAQKAKRIELEKQIEKQLKDKERERLIQRQKIQEEFEAAQKEGSSGDTGTNQGFMVPLGDLEPDQIEEEQDEIEEERKEDEVKAEAIKSLSRPKIQSLPTAKPLPPVSQPPTTNIDSSKNIPVAKKSVRLIEQSRLTKSKDTDEIPVNKHEKVDIASDPDLDGLDFDDLIGQEFVGDDVDEEISEEAIIDGILSIYEKYEHINGGLMDLRLIHSLLLELYPEITIVEVAATRNSLKNMGLITAEIEIDDLVIWLFKDLTIDEDMKVMLKVISEKGWLSKETASEILSWDVEKTLEIMKKLQDLELLRLDEQQRIVIPGLMVQNQ